MCVHGRFSNIQSHMYCVTVLCVCIRYVYVHVYRSSKQFKDKDFVQDARQCVMESLKELYTTGDEEEGVCLCVCACMSVSVCLCTEVCVCIHHLYLY